MSGVDIHRSPLRTIGLFLTACGLVALCAWLIVAHPGADGRAVTPGSFAEFVACFGVAGFGFCAMVTVPKLFQRGPVVSVGPRGIFDRRLATDWIPWEAIVSVTPMQLQRRRLLVLQVDPSIDASIDASLAFTDRARRTACLNRAFGPHGYWMDAADLRGGFPALNEAIARGQDGRATGPVNP